MNVKKLAIWFSCIGTATGFAGHAFPGTSAPTVRDVLSVPQVDNPRIAPDGSAIVYHQTTADWENNRYDTEVLISDGGQAPVLLTDNPHGSSTEARWSPDSKHIGFMADRGDGTQVYRVAITGGEPEQITDWPGGLMSFEWSPDGRNLALLLINPPNPEIARRGAEYGDFEILGESKDTAGLWLVDIAAAIAEGGVRPGSGAMRPLTRGHDVSVSVFSVDGMRLSYAFSPDSKSIVFSYGTSVEILDSINSNIGIVDIATGEVRNLTNSDAWDETPLYSPDGSHVLFTRTVVNDWLADKALMLIPVLGGDARKLEISRDGNGDTQPLLLDWTGRGIAVFFQNRTGQHAYWIDPDSGDTRAATGAPHAVKQFSASQDGLQIAFSGFDCEIATEIYRASGARVRQITSLSEQVVEWPAHKCEIIRWRARDDVEIEGVLYSSETLAKGDIAPLIIVLHGGPRVAANPRRVHNAAYPVEQWLERGARVLFPNYRGSAAYGEAFRKLTMGNIGHAESLDVIAAIDHMVKLGQSDGKQVGVAGRSWGGYLSAFLSTSTDRFKVASVGSGITDNRINYVLSNAGVAKEGYLASYPWENRELWESTSPVHYIEWASTPTLIQHGDNDVVVPTAQAYEFYQGLRDMGVPSKAVIFKDTGHNLSRPREKRAWMEQNLEWFDQYLWCTGVGAGMGD